MPIMTEYKCLNCDVYVKKANVSGKYCSNKCQHGIMVIGSVNSVETTRPTTTIFSFGTVVHTTKIVHHA